MGASTCFCFGGRDVAEVSLSEEVHVAAAPPQISTTAPCPSVDDAAAATQQQVSFLDSRDHSFASGSYMQRFSSTQVVGAALNPAGARHVRTASTPAAAMPPASGLASISAADDEADVEVGPRVTGREGSWLSRSFMRSVRGVESVVAKMRRRRAAEDGTGQPTRHMDRNQSSLNSRTEDQYGVSIRTSFSADRGTPASAAMPSAAQSDVVLTQPLPPPLPLPPLPLLVVDLAARSPRPGPATTAAPPPVDLPADPKPHSSLSTPQLDLAQPPSPPSCCGFLTCFPRSPRRRHSQHDMDQTVSEMRRIAEDMMAAAASAQAAANAATAAAQAVEAQYRTLMAAATAAAASSSSANATPQFRTHTRGEPGSLQPSVFSSGAPELTAFGYKSGQAPPQRGTQRALAHKHAHHMSDPLTAQLLAASNVAVTIETVEDDAACGMPYTLRTGGPRHQSSGQVGVTLDTARYTAGDEAALLGRNPWKAGSPQRATSMGRMDLLYRGLAGRMRKVSGPGTAAPRSSHVPPGRIMTRDSPTSASIATPSRRGLRYTVAASSTLPGGNSLAPGSRHERYMSAPGGPAGASALTTAVSAPAMALDSCEYSFNRRASMDGDDWDASFPGPPSSQAITASVGEPPQPPNSSFGSSVQRSLFAGFERSASTLRQLVSAGSPQSAPSDFSSLPPASGEFSQHAHGSGAPRQQQQEHEQQQQQRLTASVLSHFNHGYNATRQAVTQLVGLHVSERLPVSHTHSSPPQAHHPQLAVGLAPSTYEPSQLQRLARAGRSFNPRGMRNVSVSSSGVPPGPALMLPTASGSSFTHNRSRFCEVNVRTCDTSTALGWGAGLQIGTAELPTAAALPWPPPAAGSPTDPATVGRRGSALAAELAQCQARALYARDSDSGSTPCNNSLVRSDTAGSDGLVF